MELKQDQICPRCGGYMDLFKVPAVYVTCVDCGWEINEDGFEAFGGDARVCPECGEPMDYIREDDEYFCNQCNTHIERNQYESLEHNPYSTYF